MKQRSKTVLWSLVFLFVCSASHAAEDGLETDDQKAFYYLGTAMSENIRSLGLTADELALVARGMSDALLGEPVPLDPAIYGQRLNELAQQRMLASAEQEAAASGEYVARMAAEDGAVTTDSGLVIQELVAGSGASPSAGSTVKAHYHGTLRDGTVFDSSVDRGQAFETPLTNVIPCWQEAIQLMKEGGRSRITCPAELAYGNRGSGSVPGGAALTFEVELIAIVN